MKITPEAARDLVPVTGTKTVERSSVYSFHELQRTVRRSVPRGAHTVRWALRVGEGTAPTLRILYTLRDDADQQLHLTNVSI